MSIIVVEGIDSIGKSRLIDKLVEKYPERFDKFAFPTEFFKDMVDIQLNTNLQNNTLSQLIHYHTLFEIDFMNFIGELEIRSRKGVLLLDRYYMSNIVYAKANFTKRRQYAHDFISLLQRIDRGIIPDCVLYLRASDAKDFPQKEDSHFTVEQFNEMQYDYSLLLHKLRDSGKIKCFETILTLSVENRDKTLFESAEQVLRHRGFLQP